MDTKGTGPERTGIMSTGDVQGNLVHALDALEQTIESMHDGLGLETEAESLSETSAAGQRPADVATATLEREVEFGLLDDLRGQRAEVKEALHRLDDGCYGVCERCGQPIALARLEALPAARRCLDCQQIAEHWASVSTPMGLPTLGAAAEFLPDDEAEDSASPSWVEERAMQVVQDG